MSSHEATLRLAHIVPVSVQYGTDIPADLVLNALWLSHEAQSAAGVTELIAEHLGCTINRDQVAEKLAELHNRRLVLPVKGGYILSQEATKLLEGQRTARDEQREMVAQRWLEQIGSKYPTLIAADHLLLVEDLWEFLNALFLRHGVESVNVIQDTGTAPVDVVRVPADFRDTSAHLKQIEQVEFPEFLSNKDPDIIRFLLRQIDQAIRYLSTVIDPEVLKRLTSRLAGKTLFLDSSVVYRLVNLQGQLRFESVSAVVKLCQEAGFEVRVNRKTMQELGRRLKYDAAVLRKYPIPTNLAAVGVRYFTEENYVSTYWRAAQEKKLAVEDFIDYYSHIHELLHDRYGVQVESEERTLSAPEKEMAKYWMSQLGAVANEDEEYSKSLAALEHDAYNIALIDSMSGTTDEFLDSPAWFLTTDRALLRFQREHYERRHSRAFCVVPSQLMQLLRFITPRDGAYDRAFLSLFARSYIPSANGLPNEMIHEILGRIAQYHGTPTLAEKVLGDAMFIRQFRKAADDTERDEVVHDALLEKAQETEATLKEKEALVASVESHAASLQRSVAELNSDVQEKTQLWQRAVERAARAEQDDIAKQERILLLEQRLAAEEQARKDLERREQEQQADQRRKAEKAKAKRVQASRRALGVLFLLIFSIPFWWYWQRDWVGATKLIKATIFSLPCGGLIGGTYIAFDDVYATRVTAVVGIVLAAVATIYAML